VSIQNQSTLAKTTPGISTKSRGEEVADALLAYKGALSRLKKDENKAAEAGFLEALARLKVNSIGMGVTFKRKTEESVCFFSLKHLGLLCEGQKRYKESKRYLAFAFCVRPNDSSVILTLHRVAVQCGDYLLARRTLSHFLSLKRNPVLMQKCAALEERYFSSFSLNAGDSFARKRISPPEAAKVNSISLTVELPREERFLEVLSQNLISAIKTLRNGKHSDQFVRTAWVQPFVGSESVFEEENKESNEELGREKEKEKEKEIAKERAKEKEKEKEPVNVSVRALTEGSLLQRVLSAWWPEFAELMGNGLTQTLCHSAFPSVGITVEETQGETQTESVQTGDASELMTEEMEVHGTENKSKSKNENRKDAAEGRNLSEVLCQLWDDYCGENRLNLSGEGQPCRLVALHVVLFASLHSPILPMKTTQLTDALWEVMSLLTTAVVVPFFCAQLGSEECTVLLSRLAVDMLRRGNSSVAIRTGACLRLFQRLRESLLHLEVGEVSRPGRLVREKISLQWQYSLLRSTHLSTSDGSLHSSLYTQSEGLCAALQDLLARVESPESEDLPSASLRDEVVADITLLQSAAVRLRRRLAKELRNQSSLLASTTQFLGLEQRGQLPLPSAEPAVGQEATPLSQLPITALLSAPRPIPLVERPSFTHGHRVDGEGGDGREVEMEVEIEKLLQSCRLLPIALALPILARLWEDTVLTPSISGWEEGVLSCCVECVENALRDCQAGASPMLLPLNAVHWILSALVFTTQHQHSPCSSGKGDQQSVEGDMLHPLVMLLLVQLWRLEAEVDASKRQGSSPPQQLLLMESMLSSVGPTAPVLHPPHTRPIDTAAVVNVWDRLLLAWLQLVEDGLGQVEGLLSEGLLFEREGCLWDDDGHFGDNDSVTVTGNGSDVDPADEDADGDDDFESKQTEGSVQPKHAFSSDLDRYLERRKAKVRGLLTSTPQEEKEEQETTAIPPQKSPSKSSPPPPSEIEQRSSRRRSQRVVFDQVQRQEQQWRAALPAWLPLTPEWKRRCFGRRTLLVTVMEERGEGDCSMASPWELRQSHLAILRGFTPFLPSKLHSLLSFQLRWFAIRPLCMQDRAILPKGLTVPWIGAPAKKTEQARLAELEALWLSETSKDNDNKEKDLSLPLPSILQAATSPAWAAIPFEKCPKLPAFQTSAQRTLAEVLVAYCRYGEVMQPKAYLPAIRQLLTRFPWLPAGYEAIWSYSADQCHQCESLDVWVPGRVDETFLESWNVGCRALKVWETLYLRQEQLDRAILEAIALRESKWFSARQRLRGVESPDPELWKASQNIWHLTLQHQPHDPMTLMRLGGLKYKLRHSYTEVLTYLQEAVSAATVMVANREKSIKRRAKRKNSGSGKGFPLTSTLAECLYRLHATRLKMILREECPLAYLSRSRWLEPEEKQGTKYDEKHALLHDIAQVWKHLLANPLQFPHRHKVLHKMSQVVMVLEGPAAGINAIAEVITKPYGDCFFGIYSSSGYSVPQLFRYTLKYVDAVLGFIETSGCTNASVNDTVATAVRNLKRMVDLREGAPVYAFFYEYFTRNLFALSAMHQMPRTSVWMLLLADALEFMLKRPSYDEDAMAAIIATGKIWLEIESSQNISPAILSAMLVQRAPMFISSTAS
jgi:hypothetical protein